MNRRDTDGETLRAKAFLKELMLKVSQSVPCDILVVNVTPVIGTHVGPNGLGFASVRKENKRCCAWK